MPAYDTATDGPEYTGIGDLDCPSGDTRPDSTHTVDKQLTVSFKLQKVDKHFTNKLY